MGWNNRVPPGAEKRARTRAWYEENSPGQRKIVSAANLPNEQAVVPVLEVRDFGVPQAITLQLDRRTRSLGVLPANAAIRALVTYGNGGAQDNFEVDWSDGGMVTVVAQRLTVVARAVAADPDVPYDMSGLQMELIAAVGHGQPSVIMPTLTQQLGLIGPGGTSPAVFPPPFAKAVSVLGFVTPTTTADIYDRLVVRTTTLGGTALYGNVEGAYIGGGSAMPLPNNAFVNIVNTDLVESIKPTLVWQLGL